MTKKQEKLKMIVITSKVTFVPGNYELPIKEILNRKLNAELEFVFINNVSFELFIKALGMFALGVRNFSLNLIKNIFTSTFNDSRKKLIKNHKKNISEFKSLNSSDALNWLKTQSPDLILNMRSRCIFKAEVLNSAKIAAINIHHGHLPKYRGVMSDLYALSEGRPAGFTIHEMTEKLDDGDIYKVVTSDNGEEKDYMKYVLKSSEIEAKEITAFLENIIEYGKTPQSLPNHAQDIIYTKNPDSAQIKELINKGMIL